MMAARGSNNWGLDRVKIAPVDDLPVRVSSHETAEPMESILERLGKHVQARGERQEGNGTPDLSSQLIPAFLTAQIDDLALFRSDYLAKLRVALQERCTPSGKRLILMGPRQWDLQRKRFHWSEWSDEDRKQLDWAAGICRHAMAERDDSRARSAVKALMLLPSSMARGPDAVQMYLDVLEAFPAWSIERAKTVWAMGNKWRPKPAEMVEVCEGLCSLPKRIIGHADLIDKKDAAIDRQSVL